MAEVPALALDLKFLNRREAIGAYLILHPDGAVLVETGPGSTIDGLCAGLLVHGLAPKDVTHVLLTHIHLDHAGASGYLARQGAQIHVHPVGAPHMRNPEKLLASASRIYGDKMDSMWGEFLPVPPEKLVEVQDGQEVAVGNLQFTALHTPGHAEHHIAWLFEDICFTGDIGGVRLPGHLYVRLPLVPPELHIEKWRDSLARLQKIGFKRVAPTHFGIYEDVDAHLTMAQRILDESERWLKAVMPANATIEVLREKFVAWLEEQGHAAGLSEDEIETYEIANPTWMGADGLQRYWRKFRASTA